jgi:uncharacterized protein
VAVGAVLLLGAGCGGGGPQTVASTPPAEASPAATLEPLSPSNGPVGFDTVLVRATETDGTVCERCMWLADTDAERAQGLMGVTDLGGLDGMVFRYDTAERRSFWMKNTLVALSIAFVGEDGRTVATFDMEPCTGEPCPTYGPDAPVVVAVEVLQGRLDELGLGAGSVVELVGDCPG